MMAADPQITVEEMADNSSLWISICQAVPNSATITVFNSILDAFGSRGNVDYMEKFYRLLGRFNLVADAVTYTVMLQWFGKHSIL